MKNSNMQYNQYLKVETMKYERYIHTYIHTNIHTFSFKTHKHPPTPPKHTHTHEPDMQDTAGEARTSS